ncbi:MAG TPA: MBL fold metallo-hydrolase [bacterium]|nr:MBL fold metallo-hydrolase [bacterium]
MKVTFWGVRGSIPVPGSTTQKYGGNSSCVELEMDDGKRIIFDAGSGIRLLGQKIMKSAGRHSMHLMLSHGHMDHVHGFPFFGPAYMRGNHITVTGCATEGRTVKQMLQRQMGDIYFPIEFDGLPAEIDYLDHCSIDNKTKVGKSKIDTCETNHPGGGVSYKVIEKKKVLVYMTDNELMSDAAGAKPFEHFVDFVKGADVLIHDTQYTPQEYKHTKGWGHSRYTDSALLAVKAGVKKLVLFHHDPDHNDAKIDWMVGKTAGEVAKLGGKGIKCMAAREKSSIVL